MVPADVEEAAQHAVAAADHGQRLARELQRDELTGFAHLVDPAGVLPRAREGRALLQLEDARVHVPRRGAGARLLEREVRLVAVDLVEDGILHAGAPFCLHRLLRRGVRAICRKEAARHNEKGPGRSRDPALATQDQNSWENRTPKVRGWFVK